jgi:endoglucanase
MRQFRLVVMTVWFHAFVAIVTFFAAATTLLAQGRPCNVEPSEETAQGYMRGINLAGAEFRASTIPSTYGRDYIYPSAKDLDYYKSRNFSLVRLPFRWERLQPNLFQDFDTAELNRLKLFIAAAKLRDIKVIPSPHNYGRDFGDGKAELIGTKDVPIAAFADFWSRLAGEFRGETAIYAFGLMNEPHDSQGFWPTAAQAGLDAIRSKDSDRVVLAAGDEWSGAWSWKRNNKDFLLNDPTHNIIYEAHQYFDSNKSGLYKQTYDEARAYPDIGIDLVKPFAEWLREHKVRGMIAEFGVPNDDPRWLVVIDRLLGWLACEGIPWTYWAGGPWWGDYRLSSEPKDGTDAPIMSVLAKDRRAR